MLLKARSFICCHALITASKKNTTENKTKPLRSNVWASALLILNIKYVKKKKTLNQTVARVRPSGRVAEGQGVMVMAYYLCIGAELWCYCIMGLFMLR